MATRFETTPTEQGYINVTDGKLFYQKMGNGPPLVFIHGFCLDHRMWQDQTGFFSDTHTCIAYDLRGFGKSTVPVSPYSHQTDLNTLLEGLYINEPPVLIALSMGGRVAVNFALSYPEKTRALVLADAAIDGYEYKDFKLDYIYEAGRNRNVDMANQLWMTHRIFDPARKDPVVAMRLEEMVLAYSGWHWCNKNPMVALAPPAIKQLQRITAPVLIITGEKDIEDFRDLADAVHKNIPQSLKKEIKEAGHMCNMENPDAFNSLMVNFLDSLRY